ncbi:MAG: UDP-N-acetylmuramoyl-tripeptide--D-alanyl-D-alanine ligase [bacterium]|nr:UDP-N-acetylmuramoyl-tripeptide--D-alanyl-D-alanine ligase [bacterium]
MSAASYPAATAAVDILGAGLDCTVLAAAGDRLALVAPEAAPGGFEGAALDSRDLTPGQLFVALAGEQVDGRRFAPEMLAAGHWVLTHDDGEGTAALTRSAAPAAASGALVCADPVAALGVLGRSWRRRQPARIVAVTGTNGKTTTKDLLAALLAGAGPVHATRGNLNNHLGVPLTLLGLVPGHRFAVVEMGASAVGEIARLGALVRPEVGVITNAAEAHLAEFGSLEGVIEGKGEMVEAVAPAGTVILNADSPGFDTWRDRAVVRVVSFGRQGDHRWSWRADDTGGVLELDGQSWPVPLPGAHNGANLAAAILAARALDIPDPELRLGLAGFRGSPHRSVRLEMGGRLVLDDSYNANPRSVVTAASSLLIWTGGRAVAALGHMGELGTDSDRLHRQTGRELAELGLDALVSVGPEAAGLATGFADAGGEAQHCTDRAEAVAWLVNHTTAGDRVLVKGSRSAAMEEVVAGLAARLGAAGSGSTDGD